MKVIQKINNNVALCLDSKGNEVVAFGKGIGFPKTPYDVELSKIQRTYWNIDKSYLSMIKDIPPEILDIADEIVNFAREKLDNPISSNIVFTLADHISFAIQRQDENIKVKLPIVQDIRYLFETEMEIGRFGVELLKKKRKIYFDDDEAAYIALHIINAEAAGKGEKNKLDDKLIEEITRIIEKQFSIEIDKNGFSYSRFVSHMHYLLKRGNERKLLNSESHMYEAVKREYPDICTCMEKVRAYLEENLSWNMTKEECFYLMIHIHRLCDRQE